MENAEPVMIEKRPHEKLFVWSQSIKFVKEIYEATRAFPDAERYGIVSQMRRAVVSIPCNISEGASRKTRKEYVQFLYISRGSLSEMETLLHISEQLKFIEKSTYDGLRSKTESLGKMLTALINSLKR